MGSVASVPTPLRSSREETSLAALYPELRELSSCIFSETSLSLDLSILVAQFALPQCLWLGIKLQETRPEPTSLRGSLLAKSFETREDAVKWTGDVASYKVWVNWQCRRSDGLWSTLVATASLQGRAVNCSYETSSQQWTDESHVDSIVATQQHTNAIRYSDEMEAMPCVCQCVLCTRPVFMHCSDCINHTGEAATEILDGPTKEEVLSQAQVRHDITLHSPPLLVLVYRANALRRDAVQTSQ